MQDGMLHVEVKAHLRFGSATMSLKNVMQLGLDSIVELDREKGAAVELVVGDQVVAFGEVLIANGNFALRVTDALMTEAAE